MSKEERSSKKAFRDALKLAKQKGGAADHKLWLGHFNRYRQSLPMSGNGAADAAKVRGAKKLIDMIHQRGGSWGSFVNFFKNAGNKIADAAKTVYHKAIKPAGNIIKDNVVNKPISTIGKIAGLAGLIPSPASGALKAASSALSTIGSAVGKGATHPHMAMVGSGHSNLKVINGQVTMFL